MEARSRILLVDDEPEIISQLAPFLERAGYTVAVAGDGEAALRRVADFAPDLTPLVRNSEGGGLGSGDTVELGGNNLDLTPGSGNMADIQRLQEKGVTVRY